jgi:hypothetical protein
LIKDWPGALELADHARALATRRFSVGRYAAEIVDVGRLTARVAQV